MCTQVGTGAGGVCGHRRVQVQGWMCTQVGQVQGEGVHTGRTGAWVCVHTGRTGAGGGCAHR